MIFISIYLSRARQVYLEDCQSFYQLVQDLEEEGQWVTEKLNICTASIQAKDLRALTSLQQKHKALVDEMTRRHTRFLYIHQLIQRILYTIYIFIIIL